MALVNFNMRGRDSGSQVPLKTEIFVSMASSVSWMKEDPVSCSKMPL